MKQITRRLDVITKLLDDLTPVHPAGCNCAIMNRLVTAHRSECPYRLLREMVAELRSTVDTEGKADGR
jgi:hypothetical protein